jgi:hypothetical protein
MEAHPCTKYPRLYTLLYKNGLFYFPFFSFLSLLYRSILNLNLLELKTTIEIRSTINQICYSQLYVVFQFLSLFFFFFLFTNDLLSNFFNTKNQFIVDEKYSMYKLLQKR